MNNSDKNSLDLDRLTIPNIDFGSAVQKAIETQERLEKEYKEKYGDGWWEHYVEHICKPKDFDWKIKEINKSIYYGNTPSSRIGGSPDVMSDIENKYKARMWGLFGRFWKRYIQHEPNDPNINEILLKDAMKTGKWKELPDELQSEYEKMKKE